MKTAQRHDVQAVRARHLGVDLRDDHTGAVGGGLRRVTRRPQRTEPVHVRRRDLDQGRVEWHRPAGEESGDIGKKNRDEVRAALRDWPAERRADEE